MTMLANFFAKTEQVRFFPNTAIYKEKFARPPTERDLFHGQQVYCYTIQQEIHLGIPANREKTHPILLIALLNNK